MNGRKQVSGFTLLEILVVIVLIGVISAASFAAMRRSQTAAAADTFIELQAREMSQFAAAAQAYANEQKASWVVSQRYEITAAQLVTAGKLPATFAVRGGTTGASPIGELYRAFAIKDASNVARLVIADFGRAPTDALVRRAGYQVNATSLQGYKARVADAIAKATKGFSAYVPAGTMTARGPAGTFTQVLNAYFGNVAPTMPVVIELVGWPEFVIPGSQPPGGATQSVSCFILAADTPESCRNSFNGFSRCDWVPNVNRYVGPTAPPGAIAVTKIPVCDSEQLRILSPGVPGVALTYGTEERWVSTGYDVPPECDTRVGPGVVPGTGYWQPRGGFELARYQNIRLNDSVVFSGLCHYEMTEMWKPSAYSSCETRQKVSLLASSRIKQAAPVSVTTWGTIQPLTGVPVAERGHIFYCLPN